MTSSEAILFVENIRDELCSTRGALEAFARAACEQRDLAVPESWVGSTQIDRAGVASFLSRDDALGMVYQALLALALQSAYRATASECRKFKPAEIPAVTGLFTPSWVAEFLVRETLAKGRGEHRTPVRKCRLLDPACGTMNIGLAAVDVLSGMYREEMDHAGRPGWPAEPSVRDEAEIGPAILRHNLFGCDIDPVALWLARVSLGMKLGIPPEDVRANLARADGLFDKPFPGPFDAVVTNPPYLSARNLPARTVEKLKKHFRAGWRDLYACFILRSLDLCRPGGRVGLLTMQSFMFTGAFEALRTHLDDHAAIESVLHFGPGLFGAGNPGTLQTVAFTMRREPDTTRRADQKVVFYRLVDSVSSESKREAFESGNAPRFHLCQADLAKLPRRTWAYWAGDDVRRSFATLPRLGDIAPPRQGLATTDNAQFVRYWWEVEPTTSDTPCRATPGRWFSYAKSGRFRRWYESPRHRVNWEDNGREVKEEIVRRYPYLNGAWKWVAKNENWYGKPGGITYSYLTSSRFSARRLEPGSIFDVAGSSLFPPTEPLAMLAILNSSVAAELLSVINPTVNFQVGDLAELPVPRSGGAELAGLAAEAVELQRQLDTYDETSPDFRQPLPWRDGFEIARSLSRKLLDVEQRAGCLVAEQYKLQPPSPGTPGEGGGEGLHVGRTEDPHPNPLPVYREREMSARRIVSFAVGRVFGRWGEGRTRENVVSIRPVSPALIKRIREELEAFLGDAPAVGEIDEAIGGLETFLARDFYRWHVQTYASRPIYWAFGDRQRQVMLVHDHADVDTMQRAFRQIGETLPKNWRRCVDDGIGVNLAPLVTFIADRPLATTLAKLPAASWAQTKTSRRSARRASVLTSTSQ